MSFCVLQDETDRKSASPWKVKECNHASLTGFASAQFEEFFTQGLRAQREY